MSLNLETLGYKNSSATQSVLAIKEERDNIRADEMKVSAENTIHKSHPENTVKKSRGRPRKIPKKSPEGKRDDEMKVENGIDKSHSENTVKKSRGRPKKSSNESAEGKSNPRSGGAARTLRSRSQEKSKMSNNLPDHFARASASASASASGENGRKKMRKRRNTVADEFSRTKTHLRYLFHRMAYEQNFIDVYAGEGWKGQSAEKLRPEKELQRAKSEIFRWKLRVRNLFPRIDSSLSEGKLPQSLFDSEGEIDSEDIFCSKCGSKDVTLDNDIVLCDGACERAFHQFCLQPPLLKEDSIPFWLCPGCDCKDDCLDMLNDSQGINLSILDSWEKVYPEEAAAAAAGKTLDNNLELPSNDSEDDDYRPADLEAEEKGQGDELTSDESDFYSASEGSGVAPANQQNLQLSSDDSEDDDFDPDAAGVEEDIKQQSSSSDFTSSSEDLNALVEDNEANGSSHENSTMPGEFISELDEVGRGKRPSLNDEPSSPSETATNQGKCALISARREVERLDYKKLYDFVKEQYGNVSTDPSDEEYFDAADAPKRRRKGCIDSGKTPKRRARKKLNTGATNDLPIKLNKVPSEPGSSGSGVKAFAAKRLGEAATQRLLISFKENQNPEQATREKLAEELGLTVLQVYNWFRNSRWSFRHSPNFASKKLAQISSQDMGTLPHQPEQREAQNDTKGHVSVDNTEKPMQALQKVEKRGRPRKSASSAKTSNGGASHDILSNEGTHASHDIPSNEGTHASHDIPSNKGTHASHDIPSNETGTLIGDPVDVSKAQRTEDKEKT